ncbi:MAG: polyprenol monophosphomannose synthase [Promethearchaeota archaeon]
MSDSSMIDREIPLVSIVIPTYNERKNIELLIPKIIDVFNKNWPGEIIIVDDNSPDGTGEVADALAKKYPNIMVIHRKTKSGLGSAYKLGFKRASGKIVMEMDADHSHNPRDIPRLVNAVLKGYDLAIGSRYAGGNIVGWGIYRKMISKGANTLAAFILQINKFTQDVTTGYRAYRAEILNTIDMSAAVRSSGYAFQLEMLVEVIRNRFTVKEVPITFVDRRIGESKLGLKDILGFFLTVLRIRFKRIRLSTTSP